MNAVLFGLAALVPMMTGPLPVKGEVMVAQVCSDGQTRTVEIPIPGRAPSQAPCHPKGCHAGFCREEN